MSLEGLSAPKGGAAFFHGTDGEGETGLFPGMGYALVCVRRFFNARIRYQRQAAFTTQ